MHSVLYAEYGILLGVDFMKNVCSLRFFTVHKPDWSTNKLQMLSKNMHVSGSPER